MRFNNPGMSWSELERRLSGRSTSPSVSSGQIGDGGDSPAWSRRRMPYEASFSGRPLPAVVRSQDRVRYAELHCHSNFSFLDGAAHPEELVEEAARLGLEALALTDHDGMYGVVRFAQAAREVGVPTVFGAELTLELGTVRKKASRLGGNRALSLDEHPGAGQLQSPTTGGRGVGRGSRQGVPDPEGRHLVVLARDPEGYARLCRVMSAAHLAGGEKGWPILCLEDLAEAGGGHWQVLTGCRKGTVPSALLAEGPSSAARQLSKLVAAFGREHVAVELWDHGDPLDSHRNDALAALAVRAGVDLVATNNVHYHTPARRPLATALAAVGARRSLDELDGWLPAGSSAHLRSGPEQARRFARYPGVVERAAEIGSACSFDLTLVAPKLPDFPVPPGYDEMSFLRELAERGASGRYGRRHAERVPGAWRQIDYELDMIEQLGFPGYFLIVWDIVEFCRRANILCQGRGSAANSAVCYAIGITKADAVSLGLLFERFLSPERDGPPDIDLDIESDRREEAIQYVYERYGRENAAQVANVITYRPKSAVRDMAKALGHSPGQLDAWSKQVEAWGPLCATAEAGDHDIPDLVMALASQVQHFPRHLGIHSGGMVICDRPVVEVCPVEWGRMPGRSVLQWEKDDCAEVGLVKFDLLGLGMLSAIHYALDLIHQHHGVEIDLADLPQEDAVYDQLCTGDSVGVFQVESRAQMATLPRLKPRTFYDLVVEVALIRPGPIQGGSVHPYIRRRNGEEPVVYLHPRLELSLKKTLGVPLFQEQLMQMAIDVAGFTPAEADQLRQAMGSKRSTERMERLKGRLYIGMAERGITGEIADQIYEKLAAFANFGIPESHSVSFAYLVYASAWLRHHYPTAWCAAMLNAQPMGFWSPHTLVGDARRHGVVVRGPDVNVSAATATLEPCRQSAGEHAVRLGISSVRNVGEDLADHIVKGQPYTSMEDFVRRTGARLPAMEALATAGAFECFSVAADLEPTYARGRDHDCHLKLDRRKALWAAGVVSQATVDRLPGVITGARAPKLPGMSALEEAAADMWATGLSPDSHPIQFLRSSLEELGVVAAAKLASVAHGTRVTVGGVVTHRQRPATASGTTFLNLEDETGLVNVICSKGVWARYRHPARSAPALLVRGILERVEGVINLVADRIEPLPTAVPTRSRDFR